MAANEKIDKNGSRPTVFWSWQSDYSPTTCRHFTKSVLASAIKTVSDEMGVDDADRPDIDHDTRGARGMVDIAATILNKISNAAVFVADLTPIAKSKKGKWLPNPNVMIELGWAMHKPGLDRVIGVLNTASGAVIEDLPFDIRQRRVITFDLPDDAKEGARKRVAAKLKAELTSALRVNLEAHAEATAVSLQIEGVPSKPGNPSIWKSASGTLVHNDAFGHAERTEVTMPDVPRSYMRIIPGGWKDHLPSVAQIINDRNPDKFVPTSGGGWNGDYGATSEGFVCYRFHNRNEGGVRSSMNMTMFFRDTGEFWMLHGGAVEELDGHKMLSDSAMLGGWSQTLRSVMSVMDRFDARETRMVEAGVFGMEDVTRYARLPGDRTPATRNDAVEIRQHQVWDAAAQLTFLTNAYNHVQELFALERITEAKVERILLQSDRERFESRS